MIELLVVIAIIGILSSVVLASLNSARQKSRDAKRVSDVQNLQLALELYFDSNSEYPDFLIDLSPNFIPSDPVDPLGGAYVYDAYTTNARPPVVGDDCDEGTETCIFYHIGANLEGGTHSVLASDADLSGNTVEGADADGCTNEVNRYCYDLTP